MTIYFDATPLFRNKRDGIATYTIGILECLLAEDNASKYIGIAFKSDKRIKPLLEANENLTYVFLPFPRRIYNILFKLFKLPVNRFLPSTPGLIWYPNFISYPYVRNVPSVLTIHDLTFILHPELVSKRNAQYLKRFVPWSIRKTNAIVTISHTIRSEIIEKYHCRPEKILVAPPGVSSDSTNYNIRNSQQKYGLEKKYLLYIGTIEPRKNISTLLDAYHLLSADQRSEYDLVLIGKAGWDEELNNKVAALKDSGIKWLGFVEDNDKYQILKGAEVFILPSHYEGFGIPILEAMAIGIPVITSNHGSTAEVAENSALTVDVNSPNELADSIQKLISDSRLQQKYKRLGLQRVKEFTWEGSSSKLMGLFKKYDKENEK